MQLTKQVGEYLVAAELCRRGLIATTFTGNVPHYDIVASSETGQHVAIQVKAIRRGSWQLNIGHFAIVRFQGKRQSLRARSKPPVSDLICVLVVLQDDEPDRYFILDWRDLQKTLVAAHRAWLATHGGVRPRTPESLHTALRIQQIAEYEDNWDLIEERVNAH